MVFHAQVLGLAQQLEMRRVKGSAGVVPDAVSFALVDGEGLLSFDIEVERSVEPPRADIRNVERVHFHYRKGERFGQGAPYQVTFDRADFSRDVGHLNASQPGDPVSPCLAIGGLQALYERAGIEALLTRLRAFLRDAKTGSLMAAGWEPVPHGAGVAQRLGKVVPRFFQEHASSHPDDRCALGVAITGDHEGAPFVDVFPQVLQLDQIRSGIGFRNNRSEENLPPVQRAVPWIFIWPERSRVDAEPVFAAWQTLGELRTGIAGLGLTAPLDKAMGSLQIAGITGAFNCPPAGGKGLVLVIGIWRPVPIIPELFGYSADADSRRLELRAFMVRQPVTKQLVEDDARLELIIGTTPPTPELLRWVSGVPAMPSLAVLGIGALGSAIFNHLVRAGADDILVQDKDKLLPHNLARHAGDIRDLFQGKVRQAETRARTVGQHEAIRCFTYQDDLAELDLAVLLERVAGRVVVDATADEAVRLRMDDLRRAGAGVLIRTEMFHAGRLGTTFVSQPDGPTLSELMLVLVAYAVSEQAVASWLRFEALQPNGPEPLFYGFGCSSQTVRLPNYVVEQQASVAVSTIIGREISSGIALNPLDEHYRPRGWRFLPVGPFSSYTPPTEGDWTIRLSAEARTLVEGERRAALPAETGGYLYGSWDPAAKQITVVRATLLPPGSAATPARLELGPAGVGAVESRLLRKTQGRLFLCGTWHSHPNADPGLSERDRRAMRTHHERDAPMLRPTLIMIVAEDAIQAHLEVP